MICHSTDKLSIFFGYKMQTKLNKSSDGSDLLAQNITIFTKWLVMENGLMSRFQGKPN
jgi:hypothetical protein